MKLKKVVFVLLLLIGALPICAQTFTNGELDGSIGLANTPTGWQQVPYNDPACQAFSAIEATVDICDAAGPNATIGTNGNPFSGLTMCSGLHATNGLAYWHEGIKQNVTGLTIGNTYVICFYQAVVKQLNCLDESGSWRVYLDNTLVTTTAPSVSTLPFDNAALNWDLRTVTFVATASSHEIKFLPWDDDPNQVTSGSDITGGLRMGIDLISFGIPPGDPTITPVGTYCDMDAAFTLSAATPGGTWSGAGITDAMTGEFDPAVAGIGNHQIVYELPAGCLSFVSDTITIPVLMQHDATWTLPPALCASGGTIDLSTFVTGELGGTWLGSGVSGTIFDPSGLNGSIPITYLVGTAPCNDIVQQNILVINAADASWTAPTGLCNSDAPIDLSASVTGVPGGAWSGTGISGSIFDPAVGTQSITYTVGSGSCLDVVTLSINVGTTGDPSWNNNTICKSDTPVDLTGYVTGNSGGNWTGIGITGSVFDPLVGTQDLTYTVGTAGCEMSSTQTMTVVDLQVSASGIDLTCYGEIDGQATAVVSGASGTETYSWNTSPVQTTTTINNLPAGNYSVTVTDGSCIASANIDISEPAPIIAVMSAANGCLPNLGSAEAIISGGITPYTFSWSNSTSTNSTATDLDSNMYVLNVTDANGCSYIDSVLVQLFAPPVVTTHIDTTIALGDCITLNTSGANTYNWSSNGQFECIDCTSLDVCPANTTEFCVEGTDSHGCRSTDCVFITVEIICGDVFVPSAFSPNADGENDFECVYSDCMESMTFFIYNRWGEQIFESKETSFCWDGTWQGKELNSDVFVYVLNGTLINGETVNQTGNISLIR